MNREQPHEASLVLIVDDEAPIAEALSEIVADAGYRSLTAGNGRIGLELARAHRPDLIFTDLMMPYLDGAGLIAAIQAEMDDESRPPIVVMTAAGRGFALKVPHDAILNKPFDIRDVESLLDHFLDGEDPNNSANP